MEPTAFPDAEDSAGFLGFREFLGFRVWEFGGVWSLEGLGFRDSRLRV